MILTARNLDINRALLDIVADSETLVPGVSHSGYVSMIRLLVNPDPAVHSTSFITTKRFQKSIEKRFEKNMGLRDPLRKQLKAIIDEVLLQYPKTLSELSTMLLKQNVVVVSRKNAEGKMYGITFVDNQNRSVFNGSEIGRPYSVAGLQKQIDSTHQRQPQINDEAGTGFIEFNGLSTLAELMKPENEFNQTPYQLKKRKKKRKI